MKTPANLAEKDVQVRIVSEAESLAVRGDFLMRTNRPVEARALLERALHLNPEMAPVHESLGFLFYRQNQREEAEHEFERAVALDSKSYMAHYYHAFLLLKDSMRPEAFEDAQENLQRAVELNPNFAPAYAALSSLYSIHQEMLDDALKAARKAVELEPGDPAYSLNVGQVLLRMGQFEEAKKIGRRVLALARTPQAKALAEIFLAQAERSQEYQVQKAQADADERAAHKEIQEFLRKESPDGDEKTPSRPDVAAPATPSADKPGRNNERGYSMLGKMDAVSCSSNGAMDLTLEMGGIQMKLHADDITQVKFVSATWKPPANFNPCVHLKGLTAEISYRLVQGKSFAGIISTIEIRR